MGLDDCYERARVVFCSVRSQGLDVFAAIVFFMFEFSGE